MTSYTHIAWTHTKDVSISGKVKLMFFTTTYLCNLSNDFVLLCSRQCLRLILLHSWFLLPILRYFIVNRVFILLSLLIVFQISLAISLEVFMRFFHQVVMHHEVVNVLKVLLLVLVLFVVIWLFTDVVVCWLKIFRTSHVCTIVWICLHLVKLTWVLRVLSLLNPLTALWSVGRMS